MKQYSMADMVRFANYDRESHPDKPANLQSLKEYDIKRTHSNKEFAENLMKFVDAEMKKSKRRKIGRVTFVKDKREIGFGVLHLRKEKLTMVHFIIWSIEIAG